MVSAPSEMEIPIFLASIPGTSAFTTKSFFFAATSREGNHSPPSSVFLLCPPSKKESQNRSISLLILSKSLKGANSLKGFQVVNSHAISHHSFLLISNKKIITTFEFVKFSSTQNAPEKIEKFLR